MKSPYTLKHSDTEILCPECGNKNIKEKIENEIKTGEGDILKKYHCEKCKIDFIPAMIGQIQNENMINTWSKKLRLEEGFKKTTPFKKHINIIIREK